MNEATSVQATYADRNSLAEEHIKSAFRDSYSNAEFPYPPYSQIDIGLASFCVLTLVMQLAFSWQPREMPSVFPPVNDNSALFFLYRGCIETLCIDYDEDEPRFEKIMMEAEAACYGAIYLNA